MASDYLPSLDRMGITDPAQGRDETIQENPTQRGGIMLPVIFRRIFRYTD